MTSHDDLDHDYEAEPAGNGNDMQEEQAQSDDEQQDWRLLASINGGSKKSLPKRGEKDYEPGVSNSDVKNLNDSREAMFTALSGERKHTNKVHISAIWYPKLKRAKVLTARGPHFKSIGQADSTGTIYLLPEEVIYLLERGSMTLYNQTGDYKISLQGCYAACIEDCGNHERYLIYAYLKRLGYIVQRADTAPQPSTDNLLSSTPRFYSSFVSNILNLVTHQFSWIYKTVSGIFSRKIPSFGPIICAGPWWSFESIFKRLQIIPYYSHIQMQQPQRFHQSPPNLPFRIAYNVWKPRPSFKKSKPGEPDFRVVVVNSQKDKLPTPLQLEQLFATLPVSNDLVHGKQYQRLKDGYKNVIFGVADCGITSFVLFGDVSFGDEKIYRPQHYNGGSKGGRRKNKNGEVTQKATA
ncbi:tRNA-splicing endonuclease subunit sen54 N-term-domain-containing protein [Lipomyces japonicus]|uniref:tRNA-splicing endonuclease subunit sen54 N-term-domain-containing protein n=1 Tax=Lipomyces japonicus TaxID=56871 RepID=UPI0034CF3D94